MFYLYSWFSTQWVSCSIIRALSLSSPLSLTLSLTLSLSVSLFLSLSLTLTVCVAISLVIWRLRIGWCDLHLSINTSLINIGSPKALIKSHGRHPQFACIILFIYCQVFVTTPVFPSDDLIKSLFLVDICYLFRVLSGRFFPHWVQNPEAVRILTAASTVLSWPISNKWIKYVLFCIVRALDLIWRPLHWFKQNKQPNDLLPQLWHHPWITWVCSIRPTSIKT